MTEARRGACSRVAVALALVGSCRPSTPSEPVSTPAHVAETDARATPQDAHVASTCQGEPVQPVANARIPGEGGALRGLETWCADGHLDAFVQRGSTLIAARRNSAPGSAWQDAPTVVADDVDQLTPPAPAADGTEFMAWLTADSRHIAILRIGPAFHPMRVDLGVDHATSPLVAVAATRTHTYIATSDGTRDHDRLLLLRLSALGSDDGQSGIATFVLGAGRPKAAAGDAHAPLLFVADDEARGGRTDRTVTLDLDAFDHADAPHSAPTPAPAGAFHDSALTHVQGPQTAVRALGDGPPAFLVASGFGLGMPRMSTVDCQGTVVGTLCVHWRLPHVVVAGGADAEALAGPELGEHGMPLALFHAGPAYQAILMYAGSGGVGVMRVAIDASRAPGDVAYLNRPMTAPIPGMLRGALCDDIAWIVFAGDVASQPAVGALPAACVFEAPPPATRP